MLRKALEAAQTGFSRYLEEELPLSVIETNGLLPLAEAIHNIHFPSTLKKLDRAVKTLKYRELFYLQMLVGRRSWERKKQTPPRI